ncbi:hypothetical protein CC1G_14153 [Coprinopsis cinerea okayama7|uniref:Uncharacterized protein n=1 Tax=Coprinopsis cinerea (strain Okayama-7 / 130 / ATCC MYA-4618 / FGSC 9003) TaxID=240176 RepID=D6RLL4_COPC7|nr:hypothetical protein CC1G_14153 [Coprinopsis cinerea okayama7\|eukprot:XP_002911620.1 hypothetical protein CC1G_14153 [Coprinopsis cinerea okayama7\
MPSFLALVDPLDSTLTTRIMDSKRKILHSNLVTVFISGLIRLWERLNVRYSIGCCARRDKHLGTESQENFFAPRVRAGETLWESEILTDFGVCLRCAAGKGVRMLGIFVQLHLRRGNCDGDHGHTVLGSGVGCGCTCQLQ